MNLPFVKKPTFTTTKDMGETTQISTFDPVKTACFLSDWQVDECCAEFFGWRYDHRKDTYIDSKGREREMHWEAWLNPKGKGTYHNGYEDIKAPAFRTRKWGEVLAFCVEQGWEPKMIEEVDQRDGKTKYAMLLSVVKNVPASQHKGDAICRSFLAAAWTLQEEGASSSETQEKAA